jgi:hypothetical protein
LGSPLEGRRVPWLRRETCPLASHKRTLIQLLTVNNSAGKVWNQGKAFPCSENGKGLALNWSWVTPSSLKIWHSWTNAWRWRFGSYLPVKGECCTMQIVVTLILNGLPVSWRFMIGRLMTSGMHSSILHSGCVCSPMGGGWGWTCFGLRGGDSLRDSEGPSTSAFESRVSDPLAYVTHLLCL